MTAILHHRSPESTLFSSIFTSDRYVIFLNGFLSRQGTRIMNILELLKARIIENFPNISHEELLIRIKIGDELLNSLKK